MVYQFDWTRERTSVWDHHLPVILPHHVVVVNPEITAAETDIRLIVVGLIQAAQPSVAPIGVTVSHFTVHSLDLVVFICVYFLCVFFSYCIYVVLLSAQWGGPSGIEAWSSGLLFLQCFDTVGWVF